MGVLKAGLIGEHISRTRLPMALDIMCKAHDLTLEFKLIDTADLPGFDFTAKVDDLRRAGWNGVTVTHPWKTHAADYAGTGMIQGLSALGASNTLVFDDPLTGHNTDYTGFLGAWRAHMNSKPGTVAIAGAGGVARALGPALVELGADDIAIWDLNKGQADALAAKIGPKARVVTHDDLAEVISQADGLVNATPMGMREYPGTAFEATLIANQSWAFDAVYTPTHTQFLQDAEHAGLKTLSGFRLFQYMAMCSFTAYTGIAIEPLDVLPRLDALNPDQRN